MVNFDAFHWNFSSSINLQGSEFDLCQKIEDRRVQSSVFPRSANSKLGIFGIDQMLVWIMNLNIICVYNFSDEDSTDEQELIKRLTQGQARMEQIKRMLVNQRGFIVQALKQLTESNTSNVEVRQKFAQQIKEQKETIGNQFLSWI